MKKTIITSTLLIFIGILLGIKIYGAKDSMLKVFNDEEIYYFLQEGVYTSKEVMQENTKNFSAKAITYENNKYYVYVGITKEEEIAKKIKSIYEQQGYQIYIKEKTIMNEEFKNNIAQFDLLINSTNITEEILTIEEVVLANYEEITSK